MHDNNSIDSRVRQIAMEAGLRLKPPSAEWLRNRILAKLNPDAAPAAIRAVIREAAREHPDQFFNSAESMLELANTTAMQRLEESNRRSAEEREATKPDGKIPLTDKERARLDQMTAAQRNDFANVRSAALIDAATKAKAEKK